MKGDRSYTLVVGDYRCHATPTRGSWEVTARWGDRVTTRLLSYHDWTRLVLAGVRAGGSYAPNS